VDVYAQKKATADSDFCHKWVNRTLRQHVQENLKDKDFVLFADNLAAQKNTKFVRPIQALGGQVMFGPPAKTEGWQPIDTGHIGLLCVCIKCKIHSAFLLKSQPCIF